MPRNRINGLLLAVIAINMCALVGCHRSYYRRQADMEASRLIREKATDPRWDSADGTIDIDPQSRMFNPFSEDHPPIPPDDAASHQFMHSVDKKEGYPHWHANGDTDQIQSPAWMSYLPMNEQGQVVLTLDRAYQLALIHSPELQEQRETLYLSALDVSLERFGFDSQLFTGFNSFLTTQGRLRNGGSSSTTLTNQIGSNGGGLNIERLGITGANFAVGLANTILFNFAGNNTQSATSLIDFSLIQPLLRGAGRDRIMESLTQSERTLLANVRQLERFRRGFYLQVATGRNPGTGPSRGGNFLGNPGSANFNAGGFFGLLESQQRIRNQEFNVRQLEAVLDQFREFFFRERLDAIQLKQFESNVYRQQRSLLDLKTNYQASLDDFKLTLGLPPTVDLVIDDTFLDRFELISDEVNERMISISQLRKQTGAGLNQVYQIFESAGTDTSWSDFEWPSDLTQSIEKLTPFVEAAQSTLDKIVNQDRKLIEADLNKLQSSRTDRIEYLQKVKRAIDAGQIISSVDPGLFEEKSVVSAEKLRKSLSDPEMDAQEFVIVDGKEELAPRSILKRAEILKQELLEVQQRISKFADAEASLNKQAQIVEGTEKDPSYHDPELYDYIVTEFQEKIPGQLSELNNLALELSLLQALARSNTIEINDVNIDSEHAIRIARCMRRDLMNARASLVDQWRNIEFVADQLEAQVDIVFAGEIGNTGDNPFKLRLDNGQLRGGFRFDAPIVRMSERNDYREALISYQQARRNFYQFEDNLNANLRDILRNIDRSKVLFELDRLTVQVDIQNVEINRFELDAPVSVNAAGGGNSRLGTQTSRNLTDAIINLNGSQNSFLQTWVRFEVLRRNLDFDMGTMQLDQNGAWIDPGYFDGGIVTRAASMMGVQLDCQFCENVEFSYVDDGYQGTSAYGDAIYGQPTQAGQFQSEPLEQALPSNSQPDVPASPALPDLPSDGSEVIVPATPVVPSLNRPNGSGTRNSSGVPLSLFKPVQPERKVARASQPKKVASTDRATKQFASAQKTTLAARPTQSSNEFASPRLAPRIQPTLNNGMEIPRTQKQFVVEAAIDSSPKRARVAQPQQKLPQRDSKASSSRKVASAQSTPIENIEVEVAEQAAEFKIKSPVARFFRSPVDDPFAVENADSVAKTVGYASSQTNGVNIGGLIESSFESPSTESKVESVSIPTAKRVLEAVEAHAQSADSKTFKIEIEEKAPTAASPIIVRATPRAIPSPTPSRQIIEQAPTDWQDQQSSLGGLLNRFRAFPSDSQ